MPNHPRRRQGSPSKSTSPPSAGSRREAGARHGGDGAAGKDELKGAAEAAGAVNSAADPPAVTDALRRFGRMARREIEEVCPLPEPRAQAELWRLASEFEVKPVRVLTGWLWEPA